MTHEAVTKALRLAIGRGQTTSPAHAKLGPMNRTRMRLRDLPDDVNELSSAIMGAAIEVHSHLGPGLLESAHRDCLAHELRFRGVQVEAERPLPLEYKGPLVPEAYRADLLVANKVVVELKCVQAILPEHEAQLLTYLSVSGCRLGMLFNFHAAQIRDGFTRRAL